MIIVRTAATHTYYWWCVFIVSAKSSWCYEVQHFCVRHTSQPSLYGVILGLYHYDAASAGLGQQLNQQVIIPAHITNANITVGYHYDTCKNNQCVLQGLLIESSISYNNVKHDYSVIRSQMLSKIHLSPLDRSGWILGGWCATKGLRLTDYSASQNQRSVVCASHQINGCSGKMELALDKVSFHCANHAQAAPLSHGIAIIYN